MTGSNPACIFCEIVAGRLPAATVYENREVIAFLDVNPIVNGHTLLVPKPHVRTLYELPDDVAPGLMRAASRVARGLRDALGTEGLNMVQSNERAGGQTVFHLHLHILPRFMHDGVLTLDGPFRRLNWKVLGHFQPAELEPLAERIRRVVPAD